MIYQFVSIPKNASMSIHSIMTPNALPNNHKAAHKFEDKSHLFAVIRHPFDRLVSWYEYHKHNQNKYPYKALSFKRWVLMGCPVHWSDGLCKSLGVTSPLRQSEFITDPNTGEILTEHLLRYTYLQSDFKRFIGINTSLRKINATSKREKYHSYFDRETARAAERFFSHELDFYNKQIQQINEKILTKR